MKRWIWPLSAMVLTSVVLFFMANRSYQDEMEAAKQRYIGDAKRETVSDVQKLEVAIDSIYQNIRTLASLPSVRSIDRHGANLSEEAKVTFQQVYNNLANSVAVSEVYIIPLDFDPEKFDPVTLKNEEPILMFDHLIADAGMSSSATSQGPAAEAQPEIPEVEIFEYRLMKKQMEWLKQNYSDFSKIDGLNFPVISGQEIIICDNSNYIKTRNDIDRTGIVFSVPFYGVDGRIRGLISAIILSSAIRDLLPTTDHALVNKGYGISIMAKGVEDMIASHDFIKGEKIDDRLIYSEVAPLAVVDRRSPFVIWSGRPNSDFLQSETVSIIQQNWWNRLFFILSGLVALSGLLYFISTRANLDQSRALNAALEDKRMLAEKVAAGAVEQARLFQDLNADVTVLNLQLTDRAKELQLAQEEIVKRAKMAQLGTLIATVAHELRNPLGAVRTTCYALKRKLASQENHTDFDAQFARIDSGILRCDKIIGQLLDFSRTQKLTTQNVEIDSWLETLLNQEGAKLPAPISIECTLGLGNLGALIDKDRLDRVIINLLSNAVEAMTEKGKPIPAMNGRVPKIQISTALTGRGIEICVQDNGPGMSSEIISKIREPLFTTKGFGTGLGIPAAEKVIELHGGGLDIASLPNRGARFTLWLPSEHAIKVAA